MSDGLVNGEIINFSQTLPPDYLIFSKFAMEQSSS